MVISAKSPLACTTRGNSVALHQREEFVVITDCKVLLRFIQTGNIEELMHWTEAQVVAQCTQAFLSLQQWVELRHGNRKALVPAHCLANWARGTQGNFRGKPSSCFMEELLLQNIEYDRPDLVQDGELTTGTISASDRKKQCRCSLLVRQRSCQTMQRGKLQGTPLFCLSSHSLEKEG